MHVAEANIPFDQAILVLLHDFEHLFVQCHVSLYVRGVRPGHQCRDPFHRIDTRAWDGIDG